MPSFVGPDNPITWAQFHRKGGLRTLLGTAVGYGVVVAAGIFLTVRLSPANAASAVYAGWATGLLALQSLFVVIIASGRISTMIRQDIAGGIIESHRMMPISAAHAVAGYLSAGAVAISGVFVANVAVGAVASIAAGLPPARWVAANLILLAFGAFVWTVAAFAAFCSKGPGGIIALSSLAGVFGNAALLYVAPGLVVLVGPLIGGSIFNLRAAQTEVSLPLALSLCCQLLVGSIFFAGAARKFRHPDAIALGGYRGLLLLLAMVGISVLAIVRWEDFQPGFMAGAFRRADALVPFLGSAILCTAVALAPLTSFARQHVAWRKLRLDDPAAPRTVPGPLPSALLVAATLMLLVLASPTRPTSHQLAYTAVAFLCFAIPLVYLCAWVYRIVDNAKLFVGIWLFVACLVPLIIDFTRHGLSDDYASPTFTIYSTFSPIGMLLVTWTKAAANVDPRAGAVVQALVALIPVALYARDARRLAPTTPAFPVAPAA